MFQLPKEKAWLGKTDLFDEHVLQKQIYLDESNFKILLGGRRSGKSVLMLEECLRVAMNVPFAICWIVCPDYQTAKDVYLTNMLLRLEAMGVPYEYKNRDNKIKILKNKTGKVAKIEFKSAENERSVKGRELDFLGFDEFAMIDPAIWVGILPSVLTKEKVKIIVASSFRRGGVGNSRLKELVKIGDAKSSKYQKGWKSWTFPSTVSPYVNKETLELLKVGLTLSEYNQEVNCEFDEVGGSIYCLFDTSKHLKKDLQFDRNLPLNLSFDFNVRLMTTSISQIVEGKKESYIHNGKEIKEQERVLNVLDCINTKGAVVTIQRQCDLIKEYLNKLNWENDIYIYGDATGQSHHGSAVDGNSYWETVKFNFPEAYYFIPTVNPPVLSRFNAVNRLFQNANKEVGIFINDIETCKPLITDFEEIQQNKAGSDQDKSNPELTHNADNIGYLIANEFSVKKNSFDVYYLDFNKYFNRYR